MHTFLWRGATSQNQQSWVNGMLYYKANLHNALNIIRMETSGSILVASHQNEFAYFSTCEHNIA